MNDAEQDLCKFGSVLVDTCRALNVFVNVARIRSDAFWFSAFHGDNTGSNPVGDANYFSNLRASIIFSYVRFVPIAAVPSF